MKKKLMFFATFLVASLVSCSMPRTPSTNIDDEYEIVV